MDIEVTKLETLEALVNEQRAQIEQLTVNKIQLEIAVRKLSEGKEAPDESQESND